MGRIKLTAENSADPDVRGFLQSLDYALSYPDCGGVTECWACERRVLKAVDAMSINGCPDIRGEHVPKTEEYWEEQYGGYTVTKGEAPSY